MSICQDSGHSDSHALSNEQFPYVVTVAVLMEITQWLKKITDIFEEIPQTRFL